MKRLSDQQRAILKDGRYSIAAEFCGYAYPRYVVRFCGEFINSHIDGIKALNIAVNYNKERFNHV